jgi:YHS domain-containing protein
LSELADYRKIHGHCNVPKNYSENTQLGTWVKTQRSQYKLHRGGKTSAMTFSRIQEMESLAFEWAIIGAPVAWEVRLSELANYRRIHGHCNVPRNYSENTQLGMWVNNQRSQYKLHREGKTSAMTFSRIQELESLAFEWDCSGATWEDRLSELADYRKIHGNCNVPAEYTRLAKWVGNQRIQYKLHREGKTSNMTLSHIQELESLGFECVIHESLGFVSPSVIDLTDDSAHPSPASVPVPPLATYYTLAEFKSMWTMVEEDIGNSIEEIEQGSLVRSGNSRVEVRGITDTCVWKRYMACLVESVWIGYSTVHSLTTVALRFMHSFRLDR